MPEFGGLQIEVRCVKCGRLPGANITLFEMQNHLYICDACSQEAVHKGKHIAWAQDAQPPALLTRPLTASPTRQLSPANTSPLPGQLAPSNVPPDSIFALLGLPLDAPISQLTDALKQQTAAWMKRGDSPEQKKMIALLRDWRARLQDGEAFETYRLNLKKRVRGDSGAISVGGRSVFSAQEFLDACEELPEGWADGERYLRNGQLGHWILFHLEDRDLALEARRYQKWNEVSDFRALNQMLYRLVPERPFRLYAQDAWQRRDTVPSADTPLELAQLCDLSWHVAERHLYAGSLVCWLERSRGVAGLDTYYNASVAGYRDRHGDRGVGLELVLERAVPNLPKPKLVVSFDGNEGAYMLKRWDREIAHKPVTITVTNTTRGFVSLELALTAKGEVAEPGWISLQGSRPPATQHGVTIEGVIDIRGRPGEGLPATKKLLLENLRLLARGHTYRRQIVMSVRGEYGRPPSVQTFPVMLSTKYFFQGLRGILWGWGLRGGLPGLCWHFALGALLTFLPFWLLPYVLPASLLASIPTLSSFTDFMQLVAVGTLSILLFMGPQFILMGAGIAAWAGFWVGIGKGHQDYASGTGAKAFRTWGFWLATIFAIGLIFWSHTNDFIGNASTSQRVAAVAGIIIAGLLIFIITCVIALMRRRLETYLRTRYDDLLNPPGKA